MSWQDSQKIPVAQFNGYFSRGNDLDNVPQDHASLAYNVKFAPGTIMTRSGVIKSPPVISYAGGKVARFFMMLKSGLAEQLLICDGNGNLYATPNTTNPIITIPGMTDFSAINFYDRVYFSAHDGNVGVGSGIYIYDPDKNPSVRLAGGAAPTALSVMNAVDGNAGSVTAGVHILAVVFVTDSGFITPPGPKLAGVYQPTSYTAPGSKQITLSNIPTGPPGTTQRWFLGTLANQTELFLIPGAILNDNVTTSIVLDFADGTLVQSMDYLFDLYETLAASIGFINYGNRLGSWGAAEPNGSLVNMSRPGDPESVSQVSGYIVVNKPDGYRIKNCMQMNGTFYAIKDRGIFYTVDNGGDPSTWNLQTLELAVGTFCHGVSESVPGARLTVDRAFIADESGLVLFNGNIPSDMPMTWKVEDIWKRINFAGAGNTIQIVDNPLRKELFIAIPLDAATSPNYILYGDYSEAVSPFAYMPLVNPQGIKWALWQFQRNPSCIGFEGAGGGSVPFFAFGTMDASAGYIWGFSQASDNDDGTPITSYWQTALLASPAGGINNFRGLEARVTGVGNLVITITGQDSANPTAITTQILSNSSGKNLTKHVNFVGEKAMVKFQVSALHETFNFNMVTVYATPRWMSRPILT